MCLTFTVFLSWHCILLLRSFHVACFEVAQQFSVAGNQWVPDSPAVAQISSWEGDVVDQVVINLKNGTQLTYFNSEDGIEGTSGRRNGHYNIGKSIYRLNRDKADPQYLYSEIIVSVTQQLRKNGAIGLGDKLILYSHILDIPQWLKEFAPADGLPSDINKRVISGNRVSDDLETITFTANESSQIVGLHFDGARLIGVEELPFVEKILTIV